MYSLALSDKVEPLGWSGDKDPEDRLHTIGASLGIIPLALSTRY